MIRDFAPRVRGHARVKRAIAGMLARDQLHPSLILSGPAGVGKRLLAEQLAMALNCLAEEGPLPCESCASCRKAISGNHPDIQSLEKPAGRRSIAVAQVRELVEAMGLKPFEGQRRVFLILEADRLGLDGMNGLLKTLEEPPGETVTILLAERPNQLIATIHSRCQHHRLEPLEEAEVAEVLQDLGQSAAEAREAARTAAGSPGRALDEDARSRAEESRLLFEALADGRARRDPIGVAAAIAETLEAHAGNNVAKRQRIGELCQWLIRGLRDALVERISGAAPPRALAPFLAGPASDLSRTAGPGGFRRAIETLEALRDALPRSPQVTLALEGVVVDLAAIFEPMARPGTRPGAGFVSRR